MSPIFFPRKLMGLTPIFARWVLGGIFVYACIDKILDPQSFAKAVYNYQILPGSLINLTAIVLPWLELLIGVFLITGLMLRGSSFLAAGLMLIFWAALLFNMVRGLDIHCGCFSSIPEQGVTPIALYVLRDGAFLALAIFVYRSAFTHQGRADSLELKVPL